MIDNHVAFVALPSVKALHRTVALHNPVNGKVSYAQVLDVGPWNIDDDEYVFGSARPLSEQGIKTNGLHRIQGPTNRAGIDLGERVWSELGMTDNSEIEWYMLPSTEELGTSTTPTQTLEMAAAGETEWNGNNSSPVT